MISVSEAGEEITLPRQTPARSVITADFKCFCATGSDVESTVRTVYGIDIKNADGFVTVTVRGNGFLYNMVRMIVGALKALSDGKIVVEDIRKSLLTGERLKNTATMPAKGLTLVNVEY